MKKWNIVIETVERIGEIEFSFNWKVIRKGLRYLEIEVKGIGIKRGEVKKEIREKMEKWGIERIEIKEGNCWREKNERENEYLISMKGIKACEIEGIVDIEEISSDGVVGISWKSEERVKKEIEEKGGKVEEIKLIV